MSAGREQNMGETSSRTGGTVRTARARTRSSTGQHTDGGKAVRIAQEYRAAMPVVTQHCRSVGRGLNVLTAPMCARRAFRTRAENLTAQSAIAMTPTRSDHGSKVEHRRRARDKRCRADGAHDGGRLEHRRDREPVEERGKAASPGGGYTWTRCLLDSRGAAEEVSRVRHAGTQHSGSSVHGRG